MSTLAEVAKQLGDNKVIMSSYASYEKGEQPWFFSPNPNLEGATSKPSSFSKKEHWNILSLNQKMTISTLAGFGWEARTINIDNKNHLSKLINAYNDWKKELYSVFWSNGDGKKWLCNVFVGDAIYAYNKTSFVSDNQHYYSPMQINNGKSPLKKRESNEEVEVGDIVLFGNTHMEIITKIEKNTFFDDGFCSIGAGRLNKNEMGVEKCDSDFGLFLPYIGGPREIEDSDNTYYYL